MNRQIRLEVKDQFCVRQREIDPTASVQDQLHSRAVAGHGIEPAVRWIPQDALLDWCDGDHKLVPAIAAASASPISSSLR